MGSPFTAPQYADAMRALGLARDAAIDGLNDMAGSETKRLLRSSLLFEHMRRAAAAIGCRLEMAEGEGD